MGEYRVFEQVNGNLQFITTVKAANGSDAVESWIESYGDNYGKVVLLPYDSLFTRHNVYARDEPA